MIEQLLRLLDVPFFWELSRFGLDSAIGLYRRRQAVISEWGLLDGSPSVVDFGCGIGQYSSVTEGRYLGVDLHERYIRYASERRAKPGRDFRCMDITHLIEAAEKFDIVLMVDFLHHIDDENCKKLLAVAASIAKKGVVSFEPVTEQDNPIGQWIVDNDRGDYVRPLIELERLFAESPLTIAENRPLKIGPICTRAILARPPAKGGSTGKSSEALARV
jgi:SAM-dependent methyltransferase